MKIYSNTQNTFCGNLRLGKLCYKSPITKQNEKPFLLAIDSVDEFVSIFPDKIKKSLIKNIKQLFDLVENYKIKLALVRDGGPHSCTFYLYQTTPAQDTEKIFHYIPLRQALEKLNSAKVVGDIATKTHKIIVD